MARVNKRILLTNLELEVMRVVWGVAPAPLTVREVVARLNEGRRKPLAYTTVQTMLTILKDKGVLSIDTDAGRAHRFAARVSRDQVTTSMVSDLVERLFDGEVQPLLLRLVDREALSRDQLEDLKRLIDEQLDDADAPDGGRRPAGPRVPDAPRGEDA